MFLTTEYTENSEKEKVKLRFIRDYACGHTQVKNVPHRILTATVYHRIYINAVVTSLPGHSLQTLVMTRQ